MVNDAGGINGRKINFITYDDGYSPPKTVEQVRQLVEEDKVLFALQHARHAVQHGDPQVHEPEEGAAAVRRHRRVEVGRSARSSRGPWASSPTTTPKARIYAKHILANVKDAKIGVLMQNDDYGKDYFEGFKDGLGKKAAT